ncbi:MAG: non-heme iron oxygenase ferredoxin subunit [Acidobacteria bacterium]|nr:non-heme iron oxygenase ferredoxin subunit [Acidobacteriota bacterium]MDW7983598.1 non-heme iron oxygenase ferredoxin subunit [Acidobacteriota bacterium]
MSRWVKVTTLDALQADDVPYPFDVDGEPVILIRKGNEVYALQDVCTHMEYPLHDGRIEDFAIECAYHGARFDIRTGKVLALPAFVPVPAYPVRLEGREVWIDLEPG